VASTTSLRREEKVVIWCRSNIRKQNRLLEYGLWLSFTQITGSTRYEEAFDGHLAKCGRNLIGQVSQTISALVKQAGVRVASKAGKGC